MPHLDDGQIAEWIDAADQRRGQAAPGEVADHLRQCTVCRERVEDARRIAERARAILGAAAPAVTEVPPYEVVLARAGRTAVRRGVKPAWRWLAWAATVVIAGGLGWYARGAELRQAVGARQAPSIAGTRDSAAFLAAAPVAPSSGGGAVGGVAHAPGAVSAPAPGRRAANEPATVRQETSPARVDAPEAAAKAATREADTVLRDSGRGGAVAAAPTAPTAGPIPNPSGNVLGVTAMAEERLAPAGSVIPRDAAERALRGPVATIPGLPVERYELLAPARVVRVIQTLPSGAHVELYEWPAAVAEPKTDSVGAFARVRAAAPAAAAAAVATADTVTIQGLQVTARAAVRPDSLRVLLGKVRR